MNSLDLVLMYKYKPSLKGRQGCIAALSLLRKIQLRYIQNHRTNRHKPHLFVSKKQIMCSKNTYAVKRMEYRKVQIGRPVPSFQKFPDARHPVPSKLASSLFAR